MRFPYQTIPSRVRLTPRLMSPQARNIFVSPLRCIHGVMANGMPMLKAFRRKAMPVKASPVICFVWTLAFGSENPGQRKGGT